MAQHQAVGIEAGVVTSSPYDHAARQMCRRDRGRRWLPACSRPADVVTTVPDRQVAGPYPPQHPDRTNDDF